VASNALVPVSKQLLVNADDFGLSPAINAGIIHAHRDGIVTSTSIVASGSAFAEALQLAQSYPALGLGVHLTLVEEKAVSVAAKIPTLAPSGMLPKSYGALMNGLIRGHIRLPDIEREFRAQIEKCLAAGLSLTHLDSHQHTHAFPFIFRLTIRLANEYGIRGIRIPRGWPASRDLQADRFLPKCALCLLAHGDAILFSRGACKTTRRFAGLFESGDLSEQNLIQILQTLKAGTTELVCHPGCADSSGKYASWNERRQVELAALISQKVKAAIHKHAIQLVNYRQLWEEPANAAAGAV
jgi:chitin disaccharide deacetylase